MAFATGRSRADDGRAMVEGEIIAEVMEPASREVGWTGSTASAAMTASAVSAAVAGLEMELVAIDDKDFEPAMALVGGIGMCSVSSVSSCVSTSLPLGSSGCAAEL